ncbi:hypothetical protein BS50DRAFT_384791 [Corynespora cassiicola Philippines]|uniref:Uncharacterized protein n=1 Tax=Corynespora cassiicola Philippines TaxID=1448308 RepID=A0A2T2NPK3_CORCC|nr:hypothetical protein BS50DRAFT_384791 [Corynespora cassiicola Philippines]
MSLTGSRLKPAVSTLARQTMQAAFEELERTMTPTDWKETRDITLKQVRDRAVEIENQLAARQSLRNMRRLNPLLNGLEHYARVVEILCNGTPFLSWIWSPITLILRIASEYIEAFEQLIKGYQSIAESLTRFQILGHALTSKPDFQQALAVYYSDILQFHKNAYKFIRRKGWKLLFLTSWGRFQRRFDNILDDMHRHGALIDQEANAHNISEAQQMRRDIRAWREESLDQMRRDEEQTAAKHYEAILSWLKFDESEQVSIFESVSEEGDKYPGTCSWILKNNTIANWLRRRPDTSLAWLQGNPGSGKSVLSTQIVNFIRAAKHCVIFHFCTYSFVSSTKYECILRSLLLQVLRHNDDFTAHIYYDYLIKKKLPTLSILELLLQTLLGAVSDEPRETAYTWIVLDGVDECEEEKQARLVSMLSLIASRTNTDGGSVCKVLLTSRPTPSILKRLRKRQIVSLTDHPDSLENSIRLYASKRLEILRERFQQLELEHEEIEHLECLIAKKADGMFLYARLVLDYLGSNIFLSGDELKKSINQLPQQLADFYHRILSQMLANLDTRSACRIRCIFGWIAFSRRPLKKLELLSAITFSDGNSNMVTLAPRYILDICGPLVEERRDTTLAFIHVSVKDFLQCGSIRMAIDEQTALREHGIAAITCLLSGLQVFHSSFDSQTRSLRLVKGIHGFHVYATEYWAEYLLADAASNSGLDPSSILSELANQIALLLSQSNSTEGSHYDFSDETPDKRLHYLQNNQVLYKQVQYFLKSRSKHRLGVGILQEQDDPSGDLTKLQNLDGISTMLNSYQKAVELLLNQDSCPGVSAEELEIFKRHFKISAYTCRLRSCPRTTIGFETDQLRREHEATHAEGFRCSIPHCQFPVFRSEKALNVHINKYHSTQLPRTTIRRPNRPGEARQITNPAQKGPAKEESSMIGKETYNLRYDTGFGVSDPIVPFDLENFNVEYSALEYSDFEKFLQVEKESRSMQL